MPTIDELTHFNSHTREGVTILCSYFVMMWHFNSHTREGVTNRATVINRCHKISTHTPVRVWLFWHRHLISVIWFQLTHPWGCDTCTPVTFLKSSISTHTPVRVWHLPLTAVWCFQYFNSHTREGVTCQWLHSNTNQQFQLTHPWGCDPNYLIYSCISFISTHTPVRVWHNYSIYTSKLTEISTHTPVRVWHVECTDNTFKQTFQLTHPWGCDVFAWIIYPAKPNFNSHTREGVTHH